MNFSIASLLSNFVDEKLVAPKVLEKKLGATDDGSLRQLQIALDALEKIGILVKERGRYRRVMDEGVVEGKLRCSSKGFCFAIQDDEDAEDIYIRESNLSTAWNGDRVLVKILKEGSRRRSPEGEVYVILDRSITSVLARIKEAESLYRAVPLDDRLLFELDLRANGQNLADAIDHLVHVEILRYPLGQHPPVGKVTQILGSDAEAAADTEIVRCKHDLPKTFPDSVQAASAEYEEVADDSENRLDLRELLTLTIKPDGDEIRADTLDDAITLEKIAENRWRLGIHIADISDLILPGTPVDLEAEKRGTSVYLGEKVLPLIPETVAQICCLAPEKDRKALSVLLTLDEEGQVQEYEITPTLVRVDRLVSYSQVETILKGETPEGIASNLQETIGQLATLSKNIAQHRLGRGAFELNLPDTKFHYDDEGAIGALVVSSLLPARSLIIEFMILANQIIANHFHQLGVPMIYRVHPTPHLDDVQELMKLASNLEIELFLEDEESIAPQDYYKFTQQFAQSPSQKVLTYLLLSTLKPAFYSTTPKGHFGLAIEQGYTHFTSPMRRYADLLVHRVIHAVLEQGRDRRTSRAKESVNLRHSSALGKVNWNVLPADIQNDFQDIFSEIVAHLSEQERVAQEAQSDLEGLQKAEFMKAHTGEIFSGVITGVQSYGFFVELEDTLVEGLVHVSSLKDDWYEYRSRQQMLVGRKNRNQYRLGDRVDVQVKSVDYYRQQIDLVAVSGGNIATGEEEEEIIEE
ncbi:VacB/RNase II family 3'-5' exoribonuclease [Desertifilum sp. FACHB-1129]|uniref:exoribonuclease II n=1 Tax=Desertifilum tharense IPPAS B-1220 TaxID=1781255 RepID=A0A1E5QDS3_9CYAN|nr:MULTISPECIES: ribonuclease R family protein [Desertifilum]MDA0209486.1 ribonuclease R [Cyanobacteria bacterium FC1]MBD2315200.1 VacB/RNase II family 3'-5' exoribonuclease [Desertifilum sp. FACHB-1129]MBD2321054.1 VacB/RNase II family 3'-5' exoribonuclease [Desertifilum sp. FACHB-866]MBD2331183.1 VacB/RNase II family 3'-5' exoribonuclease [Desertifilum sp. FACHB-868]OEJ72473.1 iron ABC transporter substrate-binding protein [Desertifilum tharense IPPAS B-1220]